MIATEHHPYIALLYRSKDLQFWILQISGWFGLSLISFLSLTLWYNQQGPAYIGHTLLQSGLGIIVSWPLRSLFHFFWNDKFTLRLSAMLAGIIVCSLVWTILRVTTFMWITSDQGVWSDFGGWLFGSILIFLSWVALYHGIKYYQLLQDEHQTLLQIAADKQRERLKRSQAETVAHEAQLKMLRYQLNPHFLFNTLNTISALVEIKQPAKATNMIVELSQFLRYSLDNDPIHMVSLQQEVDALKLYLNIEQVRFGDRLVIEFEVQPECEEISVPSLILQPLIENAIKHGIAPNETGGKLTVKARLENDFLTIDITDTGPGAALSKIANKRKTSSGVGMKNTIDRLHAFYGDKYEFNLDSEVDDGFSFNMKLPLKNKTPSVETDDYSKT